MNHNHNSNSHAPIHHGRSTGPNGTLTSFHKAAIAALGMMIPACSVQKPYQYPPRAVGMSSEVLFKALGDAYSERSSEKAIYALVNFAKHHTSNMTDRELADARLQLDQARAFLNRDLTEDEIKWLVKCYFNLEKKLPDVSPRWTDGSSYNDGTAMAQPSSPDDALPV